MIKVCMFVNGLPIQKIGGVSTVTSDLCEGLSQHGCDVTVITTKHPEGITRNNAYGSEIHYVGDKVWTNTPKFHEEALAKFIELDRLKNFDILHTQSATGISCAFSPYRKKPIVLTCHGVWYREFEVSLINVFRNIFKRDIYTSMEQFFLSKAYLKRIIRDEIRLYRKVDHIICVSDFVNKDLRRIYRISPNKLTTIVNGIDHNIFKNKHINKELMHNKNCVRLLYCGRIVENKGIGILLDAYDQLNLDVPTELFIVGDGDDFLKYKDIVKEYNQKFMAHSLKKKIEYVGRVNSKGQELTNYYRNSDIFVIPSMRTAEGLPIAMLEAMASGTCVLASRVGGIPTAIKDDYNGILVKPGSVVELTKALSELIMNPRKRMVLENRAHKDVIKKYTKEQMANTVIQLYKDVINRFLTRQEGKMER